jgi:hypothetical protein
VVRGIVREGAVLASIGVGLGVVGALGAAALMRGVPLRRHPVDPAAFLGIPLLLAGVALLAAYLPARRAARVDPVVALRSSRRALHTGHGGNGENCMSGSRRSPPGVSGYGTALSQARTGRWGSGWVSDCEATSSGWARGSL